MPTPATAAGAAPLDIEDRDGPLPLLLFALAFVAGLLDAVSYLSLGHVFVGNMTGNTLFLAFASAGVKEFSVLASLIALVAFLVGAIGGGRLGVHAGAHRGRLLAASLSAKALLVGAALVIALVATAPLSQAISYTLIVLLALTMGLQNAIVRRLNVADLATTVLTTTLTGLAMDSRLGGGTRARVWRRSMATIAMFAGAGVGAWLAFHVGLAVVLSLALGLLIVDGVAAYRVATESAPWTAGH